MTMSNRGSCGTVGVLKAPGGEKAAGFDGTLATVSDGEESLGSSFHIGIDPHG